MVLLVSLIITAALYPVLAEFNGFDLQDNVVQFPAPSPTISLGWEATPGQFPWQLALRLISEQGTVLACGGVLVHESWAITAAQCTAGRHMAVVRAGVTNLTTPEYISEATEFYNHPSYDSERPTEAQPNDITLIKLAHPVRITQLARPIRIQPTAVAAREYESDRLIASGFGRLHTNGTPVENLHWVYLKAVPNNVCQQIFNTFDEVVTNASICAGPYNQTAQSVCYGDSGGPLVHTSEDGEPILVGITSFVYGGEAGCHSGHPGVFVRPGAFHQWFSEVTGIDFDSVDIETSSVTTIQYSTTDLPSTPKSTTEVLTTDEPTTIISTTEQPTTVILTTELPSSTIPTTTEDKTTEESTTIISTTEEPSTSITTYEPTTDIPSTVVTTNEPNTDIPSTVVTTNEPTTDKPSTIITTNEPTTKEPSTVITTNQPTTQIPTTTTLPSTSKEDSEEVSSENSSEEDPDLKELLKRLEVEVKVKLKINKYRKKRKIHDSL